MDNVKTLKVGQHIVYTDELKEPHDALITAVHGTLMLDYNNEPESIPCINLLIVSHDVSKHDTYGRQIERYSSVVHVSLNSAEANCWNWPS